MTALIFDCDGVLADTERYGHLAAFNATFSLYGLNVHWSEEEYGEKLKIGGGKERMASLFDDPSFAAAHKKDDLTAWHRTKTTIFQRLVVNLPPRPGIARIIGDALDQGWTVAVASTSAEASVRAVLQRAVGAATAARVPVFAGDIVPAKKPDPAIYELTVAELGLDKSDTLVIEDSRNGLLAATRAGLRCLVTVNGYTKDEDFTEAVLVVSELGDPDRPPISVLAGSVRPGPFLTLDDLRGCLRGRRAMTDLESTEFVVRTIAETAIENEKYFGDLDSVVGDGDFGYSLARGFEKLLEGWDGLDRTDPGTFLKRSGMVIASRIGGTSGPLWGTAFLRAGGAADSGVVAMLQAAIDGIKARGQSDVGDKTLLDALVPFTDALSAALENGASSAEALAAATVAAREAADATAEMVAKRGRAAYTGERSRGSVDAGATAVAVLAERISETWQK